MSYAFTPETLPLRMTTAEVCKLAKCSPTSLWRRRKEDPAWLPAAPVQLGRQTQFDRDAVLKALGMMKDAANDDPWTVDPNAIRAARSRKVRHAAPAQGRNLPRPDGSAAAPAPLRVVARDPAARRG